MALWITLQFLDLRWAEVLLQDLVGDVLITPVLGQLLDS
jgi:hypothetical protein